MTGRIEWTREWPVSYSGLDYGSGPRATPTVDGDRVYVLGAMGNLLCLRTATGEVIWHRDYRRDFQTVVPAWGMSAAPLVYKDMVIAVPGGKNGAKVTAFDKLTGAERWRALSTDETEPGYSQPMLIRAGGREQVIIWHAGAVSSLDPRTGHIFWEHPFKIHMSTPIATPVWSGGHLLVSAFFQGTRLFRLNDSRPDAELVWRGMSESERATDTIHALMASPLIAGEHIYGVCNYGQLRCVERATGKRVWESQAATGEQA
jgi:outer membrane protein assembly factor BamB